MPALATVADYELLIAPVPDEDEPRLTILLDVASSAVVTVAPGLQPWISWPLDDEGVPVDPGPVPPPAVLVTCQCAAGLMSDPEGSAGPVSSERVGLAQTHYETPWDRSLGLLPAGWQLLLQPWRCPELASVLLVVPHPSPARYWDRSWWWEVVEDPTP
jgi:hypothetical protein